MNYSILLIDDHQIIINGLKSQLEKDFPGSKIYEANTSTSAYEALKKHEIEIVISDLSVENYLSEIELVDRLKKMRKNIKLIVFSMHAHASIIQNLLDKGISGYVVKSSDAKDVSKAIVEVASGGTYLCNISRKAIEDIEISKPDNLIFTQREKQIIKLIVEGKKTGQIARELRITSNTVETHRKNIFKKTGTKNMAQLVQIALTLGIIDS